MIKALTVEPEIGAEYEGTVKSTTAFGAFVEIMPGTEGLVHISELAHGRTDKTEDVVKKGDRVRVKLIDRDERGRLRLSMKALVPKPEGMRRTSRTDRRVVRVAKRAAQSRSRGRRTGREHGCAGSSRWRGSRPSWRSGSRTRRSFAPVTAVSSPPESGLRSTELSNGLTVLSEHMPGVRSVAFGAWVRAASVHESRERMGVSHLLEHMVFKGTKHRTSREIALSLEVLGGSLDAYTAREHTSYQARVLDEHLVEAVDVIGDLIFRPLLRREDLLLERKVVLEEIGMVDDTPDDLVFELHNELLWGSHPYGHSILGTRETVSALGVTRAQGAARARVPSVADRGRVLGQRRARAAARGARAALGGARCRAATQRRSWCHQRAPLHLRGAHVERESAQTHIVFGATSVAHHDPRRYAVALVDTIFGGGMSSRLFQRIREELGLAYSVHTFQSFHPDTGIAGVYVGTSPATASQGGRGDRGGAGRAGDALADRRGDPCGEEPAEGAGDAVARERDVANVPCGWRCAVPRAISFARGDACADRRESPRRLSRRSAPNFILPAVKPF